jgi:hypothetical protein
VHVVREALITRPLEFAQSVGDFVSNYELRLYPLVLTSVIAAFPVNMFATLCEMLTDCIHR